MSDYDNYEEQVEQREQEAYNAAMSEAGREADRMQSEHGAYVAQLEARIAELKAIISVMNDAFESYAEFYDKCLDIIAMSDTPHCQETDDIILGYVIKGFLASPEVNNE